MTTNRGVYIRCWCEDVYNCRPGDCVRCECKCGVWFDLLDNNFILTKRLAKRQAFRYITEWYGLTIVFLKQGTKIVHFLLRYIEIALGFAVVYGVTGVEGHGKIVVTDFKTVAFHKSASGSAGKKII